MPSQVQCPTASGNGVLTVSPAAAAPGGVLTDPIDSKYLSEVPFGDRSFWIQPWRAYIDTWPASRLLDSLGINFNVNAPSGRRHRPSCYRTATSSSRASRLSWNMLSYENPTKFVSEAEVRKRLIALHEHGLRR